MYNKTLMLLEIRTFMFFGRSFFVGSWAPWGLPIGLATGVVLTNAIYVVFILSSLSLLACPFSFFVWAQAPGAHAGLPTGLATGVVCFVMINLIEYLILFNYLN